MNTRAVFLCGAALFALWLAPARADTVEADGAAVIDAGGLEKARHFAVQDAVRQAEISYAARVESSSTVGPIGVSRESLRVTPPIRATNHKILREWSEEGLLHVQIRAEFAQIDATCGNTSENRQEAAKYKKKIAAARFTTANSLQVEDISDIWNGYPLEILRQLDANAVAIPANLSSLPLTSLRESSPDGSINQEIIRQIAAQTGSQFVISGVILDAGVGKESIRPYWGWQGNESGRRFELGLPWNSVVAGIKPTATERGFEVEIVLHDGLTGAAIARHRERAIASGNVTVGRDKSFASAAFFATDFGRTVKNVIDKEVAAIKQELACLPFMATIVRLEGRKVYIDAGNTSRLSPGDKLMVYHRNPVLPASSLGTQFPLGVTESPATTVTITQVQPLFSIGELAADPAKVSIQVGDLVRNESAGSK
ncbi:MAG: flagella assembly protein FlgT [Gammaproteobacteria bacterium]|nr:flagella assembly protein FlgT [Gammaproteobacteria bacterium]MBU1732071.1 flagella assembly protein FlgT [Gammaproteobacteria bacterium]MBU1894112.1 flagella assembly protein FlgT [Gammaproteobacteria bacterium]